VLNEAPREIVLGSKAQLDVTLLNASTIAL
jgi:hypothetical protein